MNILDIAQKHVTLSKSGSHMVGPCPKCGGKSDTTRFVVNLAKNFAQCYSCGGNWDVVRFLKDIEGMTCPAAHHAADITCEFTQCPVWDKCSRGSEKTSGGHPVTASPTLPPTDQPSFTATAAENPAAAWQKHAGEYVDLCHERLLNCEEQLAYLSSRGLGLDAIKKYRLGWIPSIEFKARKAWGLQDKSGDNGKTTKTLPFPQGILIPWIVDGYVHRLRIRKTVVISAKDPRYLWVDGSGTDIICLNNKAKAHLVVESDLDGLLIDHLAGDLVGAIPLGSCSTKPKASVMEILKSSTRILVALDYDHEQRDEKLHAPGARACHWWFKEFPDTAKRWPVPVGKDPGESYSSGCDLRSWVMKGLPVSLQLQAATLVVDNNPVKNPVAVDTKGSGGVKVHIITSKDGRTVHITDDRTEYQRLVDQKKIVFDSKELALVKLSGADQGQAACFLNAKQVFPGAKIVKTDITTQPTEKPSYAGKFAR